MRLLGFHTDARASAVAKRVGGSGRGFVRDRETAASAGWRIEEDMKFCFQALDRLQKGGFPARKAPRRLKPHLFGRHDRSAEALRHAKATSLAGYRRGLRPRDRRGVRPSI